jgi:hypothetical protein
MALATVALVLASGERTFQGMRNFTGAAGDDQQFGTAVSLLITFGLQVLMVILSWRIGDAYASSSRVDYAVAVPPQRTTLLYSFARVFADNFFVRHFLLVVSFAICAIVCLFFSFDAFYQGISTSKQRDIVSRNEAFRVLREIDARLTPILAEQQEQAASKLSSGPAWEAYQRRINDVVMAATDPGLIRVQESRAKQQREDEQKRAQEASKAVEAAQLSQNEAKAAASQLTTEKLRLESTAKEQAATLARLKQDRQDRLKLIGDKETEVDQARARMDEEEKIGAGRRNANGDLEIGRGPRWKELKAVYELRMKEKANLEDASKKLDQEIAAAEQRSGDLANDIERKILALSNAEAKLNTITTQNKSVVSIRRNEMDNTANVARAAEEARLLDALPAKFFGERTSANWADIEKQCIRVLNLLREIPESRAKANGLLCEPSVDTRALAASFFELEQGRENFRQRCTTSDTSALSFLELIDRGKQCLHTAQLQDKVATQLEDRLDRVAEEQDEKAHTFVRTISAFDRGDKLAYIAAIIAFSLDGLIVLSGIWGARTNTSQLTGGGEITASEMDEHARMVMALEIRPEKLRPSIGWAEPPEVYKARLFLSNVKPYHDSRRPEFTGAIFCAGLDGQERDAVNSVLAIGTFAEPVDSRLQAETWLVSRRLIHYVTAIAANYDRLQRIHQAAEAALPEPVEVTPKVEFESDQSYWARAAAAAKGGRPAVSEAELAARGFVERAHEAFRADDVLSRDENDNSVVRPSWGAARKTKMPDSAAG